MMQTEQNEVNRKVQAYKYNWTLSVGLHKNTTIESLIMLVVYLLTVIAALAAGSPVPDTEGLVPDTEAPNGIRQCARSECPIYTELDVLGPDIWKRRIEPGLWARRVAPTCNRTAAVRSVYMDLHHYFVDNGIDRTAPIMVEVLENKVKPLFCPEQSESYPCCDEIYVLLFYIPEVSQATAPLPSKESRVELVHMNDPKEFYGITFSGRPTNHNATRKYKELTEYLDEQLIRFEDDAYLVAAYDAPWRPKPHRNEILISVPREDRNIYDNDGKVNENDGRNNEGDQDQGRGDGRRRGRRQRRNVDSLPNIDLIPF